MTVKAPIQGTMNEILILQHAPNVRCSVYLLGTGLSLPSCIQSHRSSHTCFKFFGTYLRLKSESMANSDGWRLQTTLSYCARASVLLKRID